ncbi:MAG: FecR domain-containing protein [Pseudomonadales bacterium]
MQSLVLASAAANADDWLYTIKPGDTLWDVCANYVTALKPQCIAKLHVYNTQITNKRKLTPGMQIKIPVTLLKYPPKSAVVEFTQGDAFLVRPGLAQKETLKAGTALIIGSKVITESGSVLMRFADESTLLLKPNSEILMDKLSAHGEYGMVDTYIHLNRGNAALKVKPKSKEARFRINTPSAVAAVRGTEFRISSDPATNNTMRNEVLLGEVAVSAQAVVQAIKKGFGTLAEQGKAPLPPRKLLAAPTVNVQTPLSLPYTLSWSALDGAVNYVLDIFKCDSTDKLLQSFVLDNNSHRLTDLDDGNYTLSVRGVDEVGLQGLDAILSFIKENLLPAPRIDPMAINPVANQLHISWPPVAGAKGYRVDVGSDAQFNQLIYSTVVKEHSVSAPLFIRHHYFVRAQTIDRHGRLSVPGPVTQWTNKTVELWLALAAVIAALLLVLRFR